MLDKSETINYRRKYADQARELSAIDQVRATWIVVRQWIVIALGLAFPVAVIYAWTDQTDLLVALRSLSFAGIIAVLSALAASMVVVAGRQHALAVAMHDAVHYRMYESRKLAEVVSNWLCAFPVGLVTSLYRRGHLPHHLFTNQPNDPDWVVLSEDEHFRFPKQRGAFYRLLVGDVLALNIRRWWKIIRFWSGYSFIFKKNGGGFMSVSLRVQFGLFWALVAVGVTMLHAWLYFLILWLVPMYTLVLAFMRVRTVAEHDMSRGDTELQRTRHVDGTFIERHTVAPLNINYHIAHHLWPSIPLYNLPKMHAILMQNPEFRQRAALWRTYLGKNNGLISSMLL